MFSEKKFIEASRDFVCVRLETFENKEHEALVREILNGRFANTSFCIFSPDGKTQLTRSSRGPKTILGAKGRGPSAQPGSLDEVVAAMADLVEPYPRKGRAEDLTLQDFHSFRYLGMTEAQTLRTWTIISVAISLIGFAFTVALSLIL